MKWPKIERLRMSINESMLLQTIAKCIFGFAVLTYGEPSLLDAVVSVIITP